MPSEKGKDKSSKPNYMQRCVGDLIAQGKSKEAAFAICTATMQKAGYLTKGPGMEQTAKGEKRARQFAQQKDNKKKLADYEQAIKAESIGTLRHVGVLFELEQRLSAQSVARIGLVAEARGRYNPDERFDDTLLGPNQMDRVWPRPMVQDLKRVRQEVRDAIEDEAAKKSGLADAIKQNDYSVGPAERRVIVRMLERMRKSEMLPLHQEFALNDAENGSVTDLVLADAAARAVVYYMQAGDEVEDLSMSIYSGLDSSVWE